jgi:ABC-type multidrug transport system ATPase subunit
MMLSQLKVLLLKNFLTIKRDKRVLLIYVIGVFYIVFIEVITGFLYSYEDRNETYMRSGLTSLNGMKKSDNTYLGFIYPNSSNETETITNLILQNKIFNSSNIEPVILKSEKELEDLNEKGGVLAGIVFSDNLLSYTIRLNHEYVPDPKDESTTSDFILNVNSTKTDGYFDYFVPLQSAVDQAIIQYKSNSSVNINSNYGSLAVKLQKVEEPDINMLLFFALFYVYFVAMYIPIYVVSEKEEGVKKNLIINGVSAFTYYFSWLLLLTIMLFIPYIIVFLVNILFKTLSIANNILNILSLNLFVIGILPLMMFISLFFSSSKTFTQIIALIGVFIMYIPLIFKHSQDSVLIFDYVFICFPVVRMLNKSFQNNANGITSFIDVFKSSLNFIICCIVCIALFTLLLLIFDSFISEENDSILGKLFRKRNKKGERNDYDVATYSEKYKEDIEVYPTNEKCIAEISNVLKKFKYKKNSQANTNNDNLLVDGSEFCAVNHVSFKVYENEIFGILGHNGAGKSTLINMMIGLLNPNEGHIYYDGENLITNKTKIRQLFGICPQNCGLFNKLTVRDNLKIFAGLKNIDINVDEILKEVGLLDEKENIVDVLSGGQKKRLNIAIAFMGNPRFVFLDEPTTGLDPLSRRNMWNLIMKHKNGKAIFLTTHYMDEADILTDRKLILQKGVIRCLGSSMYLKKHFNIMYNLQIETNNRNITQQIVHKHIPEAIAIQQNNNNNNNNNNNSYINTNNNVNNEYGHVYTFKLPMNSVSRISGLLNELEGPAKQQNIINKFSITLPSLEELFIRLELQKDKKDNIHEGNESENGTDVNNDSVILINKRAVLPQCDELKEINDSERISILTKLRYKIYLKNKTLLFNSVLYPIIFVIIVFFILKYSLKDKKTEFESLDLTYGKNQMYKESLWNFVTEESSTLDANTFSSVLGKEKMTEINNLTLDETILSRNSTIDDLKNLYILSLTGNKTSNSYDFDIYYNKLLTHSPPIIFNGLSNAILKSQNINEQITVASKPFSYYDNIIGSKIFNYALTFLSVAVIFSLSTFGILMIRENVNGLKKQLLLNKVNSKCYWVSCILIDFIFFGIVCFSIVVIGLIFHFESFYQKYSLIAYVFIILASIFGSLFFQYTLCLFFKKENLAYSTISLIHVALLLLGYNILLNVNELSLAKTPNVQTLLTDSTVKYFGIYSFLYPPFAIIVGFYFTIKMNIQHQIYGLELTKDKYFDSKNGFSVVLMATALSIIFYFTLLTYIDKKLNGKKESKSKQIEKLIEANERLLQENEDLYREMESVKNEGERQRMPISVLHLMKEFNFILKTNEKKVKLKNSKDYDYGDVHRSQYNPTRYVRTIIEDVSFGVKEKECFGLLGPNGVGKSTLLNVITSTFPPTSGNVYFNGQPSDESNEIVGYCPQKDILWEELTVLDHVMLYLRLRGVPKDRVKDIALQYINFTQISEHKNKYAGKLSGGTKRKLCILLAVCTSPKQIILDEPTSGIDPATRFFIWEMIKELKESSHSSFILTTHSMEEAQELCDRLTILINGRLVCIGSPDYLRMKYSQSYILEIQLPSSKTSSKDRISDLLFGNNGPFNDHTYKEEVITDYRIKYQIQIQERGLGQLFNAMEKFKEEGLIFDYTISQSSLEQVFIDFARQFNKE